MSMHMYFFQAHVGNHQVQSSGLERGHVETSRQRLRCRPWYADGSSAGHVVYFVVSFRSLAPSRAAPAQWTGVVGPLSDPPPPAFLVPATLL